VIAEIIMHWAGDQVAKRMPTSLPEGIGLPEHALLAIISFVAFSVILMLLHALFRGAVFSNPVVVPVLGIAVLVTGVIRRQKASGGHRW